MDETDKIFLFMISTVVLFFVLIGLTIYLSEMEKDKLCQESGYEEAVGKYCIKNNIAKAMLISKGMGWKVVKFEGSLFTREKK